MHVHLRATNLFSQKRFASITKDYKKFILIIYSLASGSGLEAFNLYSNLLSSCIIQRNAERKYVSSNITDVPFLYTYEYFLSLSTLWRWLKHDDVMRAQTLIKAAWDNTNLFLCRKSRWIQRNVGMNERKREEKAALSFELFSPAVYRSSKLVCKHKKGLSGAGLRHIKQHLIVTSLLKTPSLNHVKQVKLM